MPHLLWIPLTLFMSCVIAYTSYKNNSAGGNWFWIAWLSGVLPLWTIICKYSKNVVLDGIIYDVIITVGYTLAIAYFTKEFGRMSFLNYCGLALIFIGMFFFKK